MNIELNSKWIKDGEVVGVKALTTSCTLVEIVWYSKNDEKKHVLTKDDFLEQYKPYEVMYEYKWVQIRNGNAYETEGYYAENSEISTNELDFWNGCLVAPLLKTKRERKCTH